MRYYINLLPVDELSIGDHIVYFSFHYLRYVLVITQLVVACVFFYRFKVDQDIIDLRESVSQKKQIAIAMAPILQDISENGRKTNAISNMLKKQYASELFLSNKNKELNENCELSSGADNFFYCKKTFCDQKYLMQIQNALAQKDISVSILKNEDFRCTYEIK